MKTAGKNLEPGTEDVEAAEGRTPPQIYQVPAWEGCVKTPTRPESIIHKVVDGAKVLNTTVDADLHHLKPHTATSWKKSDGSLSRSGIKKALEEGVISHPQPARTDESVQAGTTSACIIVASRHQTLVSKVRSAFLAGLDHVFPPEKLYFGQPRRFFLLAVIGPLAVILLIVLPLGLGLGLGLKGAGKTLPLPDNAGLFAGDLTYFYPALGACGWTNSEDDYIVAVSRLVWDEVQVGTDPGNNPLCGHKIRIQREFDGALRSVDVTVADRCVGCAASDLDVAPVAFSQLALQEQGRVFCTWAWLNDA